MPTRTSNPYPVWVVENRLQRLYNIWAKMLYRCRNPKCDHFGNYGGRGIRVYDEWSEFRSFAAWALANGYAAHLTIERRDTNGHYQPDNCTWVTRRAQNQNQRKTHRMPDGSAGVEEARRNGVSVATFRYRVEMSWPVDLAASAPRGARLRTLLKGGKVHHREGGQ